MAFVPLAHAFNCRGRRASLLSPALRANVFLWVAVLASAALQALALVVPPLHGVYRVVPLGLQDWLVLAGLTVLVVPAWELCKAIFRARDRRSVAEATPAPSR